MAVEAITGRGAKRARAICDSCARVEVVACDFIDRPNHRVEANEGQVLRKMTGRGWEIVKGKLHCPACEAKRRSKMVTKKDTAAAVVVASDPPRQPNRDQKRLVILALEEAYDPVAQRYRGDTSDRSLADGLGEGIMPGWVSSLREEFFGPAGNEEAEAIRVQIDRMADETKARVDALMSGAAKIKAETAAALAGLTARLDALYRVEDKRVR